MYIGSISSVPVWWWFKRLYVVLEPCLYIFDTSFKPNEQKCRYIKERLISIQLLIFIFQQFPEKWKQWAKRKGTQKPYSYFTISNKPDRAAAFSYITLLKFALPLSGQKRNVYEDILSLSYSVTPTAVTWKLQVLMSFGQSKLMYLYWLLFLILIYMKILNITIIRSNRSTMCNWVKYKRKSVLVLYWFLQQIYKKCSSQHFCSTSYNLMLKYHSGLENYHYVYSVAMIYITESTVVNKLTVALYSTHKDLPEMEIICFSDIWQKIEV